MEENIGYEKLKRRRSDEIGYRSSKNDSDDSLPNDYWIDVPWVFNNEGEEI